LAVLKEVKNIISNALKENRFKLLEHEALRLCELYGIPVASYGLARSLDEALTIAKKIGFPSVAKVVSPDISHKSDVGGVILNLKDEEDIAKAYEKIMNEVPKRVPNARIYGVLIQKMASPGIEVIVGGTRDPTFGPVVMFGLGGIFVEILKDVSFRIAPVTRYDAISMIEEIKASKILDGYRGMPPRDKDALVDIIIKLSKLMEEVEEITDVDLNPIMSFEKGKGAKVADARILIR